MKKFLIVIVTIYFILATWLNFDITTAKSIRQMQQNIHSIEAQMKEIQE